MAVLDLRRKAGARQSMAKLTVEVTWTKANLDAASQAVENEFEVTCRPALKGAITAAAAPFIFSDGAKDDIIDVWLGQTGAVKDGELRVRGPK